MKIILVGGGKVGTALARQLSEEDHNVTIVDTNKARVEHLTESYDVLGIVGNGSSITTLAEAGIEDADVFIAVTGSGAESAVLHVCQKGGPLPCNCPCAQPVLQS